MYLVPPTLPLDRRPEWCHHSLSFFSLFLFYDQLKFATNHCLFFFSLLRKKWPKSTSRLKKNAPYLSRLVWRNNMFLPRPIWMLVFDIISLLPFSLVKHVYVDSTYIFLWEFPSALRVYRVLAHYGYF